MSQFRVSLYAFIRIFRFDYIIVLILSILVLLILSYGNVGTWRLSLHLKNQRTLVNGVKSYYIGLFYHFVILIVLYT